MTIEGEKFVDVKGIKTRYIHKGSGPNCILLHGGNFGSTTSADAIEDWGQTIDDIASWASVFAFDKLGQGYTDNPKVDNDYTMDAVVKHAYHTIRTLGIESAHLIGHSRGGYLTCRLTVEHPEMALSCIIVNSNTCAPGTGTNELVFANRPGIALTKESQKWILERYSYGSECVSEEWLDALVEIAQQQKYAESIDKMNNQGLLWTKFLPGLQTDKEDMYQVLQSRGIQRPVLQVWSYNDPTVSHAQAFELYRMLASKERRARWQIFNQAGHFSFREQPKRFNETVRSFINSY